VEQYSSTNNSSQVFPFSALTLLVGRHERKTEKLKDATREHIVCAVKQIMCWRVLHHAVFANEGSGVRV